MYLFIEKGMRGSISSITKRHSKIDNGTKTIMYWDANNLYGWVMSQYLPCREIKWLNKKEISEFCLDCISENSIIGYVLEVDLEYPDELYDSHNDHVLAPEKFKISSNMLSKYCSNIANEHGIKVGQVNKLVPNLRDKIKYVVHYRNLQLYLSSGMKLTKIHKILKFRQSNWLKEYIEFNSNKRKNALNTFEKNFFSKK